MSNLVSCLTGGGRGYLTSLAAVRWHAFALRPSSEHSRVRSVPIVICTAQRLCCVQLWLVSRQQHHAVVVPHPHRHAAAPLTRAAHSTVIKAGDLVQLLTPEEGQDDAGNEAGSSRGRRGGAQSGKGANTRCAECRHVSLHAADQLAAMCVHCGLQAGYGVACSRIDGLLAEQSACVAQAAVVCLGLVCAVTIPGPWATGWSNISGSTRRRVCATACSCGSGCRRGCQVGKCGGTEYAYHAVLAPLFGEQVLVLF